MWKITDSLWYICCPVLQVAALYFVDLGVYVEQPFKMLDSEPDKEIGSDEYAGLASAGPSAPVVLSREEAQGILDVTNALRNVEVALDETLLLAKEERYFVEDCRLNLINGFDGPAITVTDSLPNSRINNIQIQT